MKSPAAAAGLLETAFVTPFGPGKGAPLMAEQFALQQVFRNFGAINAVHELPDFCVEHRIKRESRPDGRVGRIAVDDILLDETRLPGRDGVLGLRHCYLLSSATTSMPFSDT